LVLSSFDIIITTSKSERENQRMIKVRENQRMSMRNLIIKVRERE